MWKRRDKRRRHQEHSEDQADFQRLLDPAADAADDQQDEIPPDPREADADADTDEDADAATDTEDIPPSMAYTILRRPWRARKYYYASMIPELITIVALLVLFGLAQPNTYRTKFWQIGFDNGFNSNPNMILYAYANHEALPTVPFVWSQALTDLNVAASVLSLFVLLAKMIGLIMHVFYPIFGFVMSLAMVGLYTTSVYGQIGPDFADSRYPSPVAWYVAKSCSYAQPYGIVTDCYMAKGSLAASVFMLFIYLVNLGFSGFALWPNKALDVVEDDESEDDVPAASSKQWEMQPRAMRSPRTPRNPGNMMMSGGAGGMASPFTPRTQAFHTLDRNATSFTSHASPFTSNASPFTPGASPFTPGSQAFHSLERKLPLRA